MSDAFAPKQQRSRETLQRLLVATIRTLNEHGLASATIPRIARAAGVAPASIYRRFSDRDALYRAAFTHVLEQSIVNKREWLGIEAFSDRSLEGVIVGILGFILRQYTDYPGLMRAFSRFVETDSDESFKRRALELVSTNLRFAIDLIERQFRGKINHRRPRRAITLALLTAVSAIETHAAKQASGWHAMLPSLSDGELKRELTRLVLAYLT